MYWKNGPGAIGILRPLAHRRRLVSLAEVVINVNLKTRLRTCFALRRRAKRRYMEMVLAVLGELLEQLLHVFSRARRLLSERSSTKLRRCRNSRAAGEKFLTRTSSHLSQFSKRRRFTRENSAALAGLDFDTAAVPHLASPRQQMAMLRMFGRSLHSKYGPTADTGGLMQQHAPTIYIYPD
jgi:hypothetical protein